LNVRPPRNAYETTAISASSEASLFSLDEIPSSLVNFDGGKAKIRTRRRLSPKSRAKAALIRYLGSCQVCQNRRVPCPLEHHDIEALERERLKSKTKPSERVTRRLRCHFDARYPHRFCATRSTGNKYHVCSKEGYLTIFISSKFRVILSMINFPNSRRQHHKSTHTVSRCPRCGELFENDSLRDAHAHRDVCCEKLLPEQWPGTGQAENINETIRQRINNILSSRGYYLLPQTTKSAIELWVDANIAEYAGASALHKDRLELKNWYLMWLALLPDIPAPTHPCECNPASLFSMQCLLQAVYDGPSETPVEDEIFIEVFQSTVDARIARGQMMIVPAEIMSQILDCLRETQRIRSQTAQPVMQITAPKVEAKTEQKRPNSALNPSESEPPSKRASVKPEDRTFLRPEAQGFVNTSPFDSSRFTETASWFSSIPGFRSTQEQTPPFSTGPVPSDSFDISPDYPASQPFPEWNDYFSGSEFFPDQGCLNENAPLCIQNEECLSNILDFESSKFAHG
jgi:hypothetical protein